MSKPGRNDPCPCGSGQKFKKCCENKKGKRFHAEVISGGETPAPASVETAKIASLFFKRAPEEKPEEGPKNPVM